MQTNTALGVGIGNLIASAFNPGNQGTLDGMRVNELQSQLRLQDAQRRKVEQEADNLAAEANMRNPDSIIETLLKASGAGGKTAVNDFKAYLDGGKLPSTALPGSASALLDGSNTIEPTYVKRFPQLAQRYGALRESLMLGNKDPDKMEKAIGQGQRNRITETITPNNAVDVSKMVAAWEGKDPTKVIEADITQRIANGENYAPLASALIATKGKGVYDGLAGGGGVVDVTTGKQQLNDVGKSAATQNYAKANQANAGAKENLAQAVLAGVRGENIKAGKGDGSQATQRDMAQLRDDARSEYNLTYPINPTTGQRTIRVDGKSVPAPTFQEFERGWLKKYNIDEGVYFRNVDQKKPTAAQPKIYKLPAGAKQIGTSKGKPVYQTPDGKKFIGE